MSLSQRYTDNVKAITLLKELGAKSATEDQISILAKYTGWGGFSSWFTDIENADKIDHLHSITSEDEFNSLFRGILDAFYTPQPISACIFEHFKACGLKSSHKVLDPAFGLGSLAKPFMGNANVYGIEKDILTAQISKKVYPQANIKQQGFEENSFPNKYFDAIVCNPPFGSHTMIDPLEKHYSSLSIHEHFILRSLDLLAEKGLFALIVTSGFLDSHNAKTTKTRKLIDDRTNIKNIFRLPTSTFNASGTSVSVDLLILEKKSDEEITFSLTEGETNPILINKTSRLEDIDPMAIKGSINDFFIHNRECILGDSKVISDQFGNFSVVAKGTNENALLKIKSNLTRFSMDPVPFEKEDPLNFTSEELGLKDADQINMFEYFYSDVVNCYVIKTDSNTFLSFPAITKSSKKGKIIEHSIRLANQLSKLLMLESSNADHSLLAAERDLLNSIYDDFSSKFGAINNTRNNFLLEDNRIMTVYGLECDYKRKITERQATKQDVLPQEESWTKAQIFNERILQPSDNLTFANTEIEALTFSLIKTGEVDFNYMTSISNFNTDQLISSLAGGYIFMNPVTMNYEVKDRYVSGNLRKKLREVKNYNGDLDLTSNIDVLTKSLPVELKPHELKIPFMAGWIPVKYLEDFITHITGSTDNEVVKIQGSFHCSLDFSNSSSNKKYGTEDVTASNLLQDIINKKAIKVYRKIGTERILDEEATLVASVKAEEIKAEWDNYLNNDPKKLHELCSIYNETVNCYSLVKYNGEHLTIAKGRYINQSTAFEYNKHQIDCIWRQLIQRGGLIAHTVGAGKTSVAIGVTYLGVEMGIYSNPIIPVLSNTLHQWYSEYKRIFPQARVLLIDDNNKSSKSSSRRRLLSRVSTEKWHAIICSHETFTSIEKPVDGTRQVIKEMKDECDSLEIEKYLQDNEDTVTGRYISRKIEATNTRIQKAINKSTLRKGYGFELLNTNYICIDESDAFKNMMFYTAFNDLRGLGSPSGSGRAFDCLCKIRHVNNKHRNDCKGLTLITGSPITNSISETFTLARYLYAEQLAEQNLNSFDAFVTTYCSPSTEYEITCTGEYKLQTRLRDFSNLMELNASFRAFSDCVTNEHLIKEYEKNGDVWPIPELEGGKPIDIVTEPGKEFLAYNDALIKRTENLETKSDKRLIGLYPNDNKLSIISNSETAALDLRLAKDISNYDIPLTDYKNSKIDAVVANTVATFKEKLPHEKTAQLIFIDKGTPKKNSDSFSVYHLIKQKLISAGLHAHEIEFIHDATNSQQRSEMFARVRSAKTRVLISSTAKAGAGSNIQDRLIALHHVSLYWNPRPLIQQIGRIQRRGNIFFNNSLERFKNGEIDKSQLFKVRVYRYALKLSMDGMLLQACETKTNFINSFLSDEFTSRDFSYRDESSMSISEFKARTAGRPELLLQVQNNMALRKLLAIQTEYNKKVANHIYYINYLSEKTERLQELITSDTSKISDYEEIDNFFRDHKTINSKLFSKGWNAKRLGSTEKTIKHLLANYLKTINSNNVSYQDFFTCEAGTVQISISSNSQAKLRFFPSEVVSSESELLLLANLNKQDFDAISLINNYSNLINQLKIRKSELASYQRYLKEHNDIEIESFQYKAELDLAKNNDLLLKIAIESQQLTVNGVNVLDLKIPEITQNSQEDSNQECLTIKVIEPVNYAILKDDISGDSLTNIEEGGALEKICNSYVAPKSFNFTKSDQLSFSF